MADADSVVVAPKLGEEGEQRPKLTMMPHKGFVFLDNTKAGQVLTHSLCLKRQLIPTEMSPCEFVFDDDGHGVLQTGGGSAALLLLEDWMTRKPYTSDSGEIWIVEKAPDSSRGTKWNLTSKMREYLSCAAAFSLDGTELAFTTYHVTWPRGGCFVMWACQDFYTSLRLVSYKGQGSKWVYESLPSWQAIMSCYHKQAHFVKSWTRLDPDEALKSTTHSLPSTSFTTLAALVLMCRWARSPVRLGSCGVEVLTHASPWPCSRKGPAPCPLTSSWKRLPRGSSDGRALLLRASHL